MIKNQLPVDAIYAALVAWGNYNNNGADDLVYSSCVPLHHEIDFSAGMTPQDTQMSFPVFAPKTPSAPNDSCWDVADGLI